MRIAFMGTPDFAAAVLSALMASDHEVVAVVSQPDRRAGRGNKLTSPPVARLAQERGLPLAQPEKVGTRDLRQWLSAREPELAVVAAFGQILGPKLLALPPLGCVNVHASLLPRWRGAAPIQAAILAGDAQSGVAIMEMERGLDTGPVLRAEALELHGQETGASLHDRLAEAGARLLLQVLDDLEGHRAQAMAQEESQVTWAPPLSRADGDLDWSEPAPAIERRIRALHPWPGTRTQVMGRPERLKIHPPARPLATLPLPAGSKDISPPGTILSASAEGVDVAAGEGTIVRLTSLQAPGKRALDAGAFLAGYSLKRGDRFQ